MKRYITLFGLTVIYILFWCLNLLAQDEWLLESELELIEEEESVVESAAKYKQEISKAPSAITVITEEDIRISGATSIAELLRTVPGMVVKYYNPGYPITCIRDVCPKTANRILVLVDGREVNWELSGMPLWEVLGISITDIKRIEVIRGPGSALYGANAYSGVVNIQTKRPEEAKGFRSYLLGDQFENFQVAGTAGNMTGKWGYLISASTRQTKDWVKRDEESFGFESGRLLIERNATGESTFSLDLGGSHVETIMPTAQINFETWGLINHLIASYQIKGLRTRAYWNRQSLSLSNRFLTFAELHDLLNELMSGEDKEGIFELLTLIIGEQLTPEQSDKMMAHLMGIEVEDLSEVLEIAYTGFTSRIIANTYDLSADYVHEIGGWNKVIVGGNLRQSTFESLAFIGREVIERKAGGFIQDEISLFDVAALTGGLRYDWSDKVPSEFSPRGSLVIFPITNHSLRLSVGRAFRKPTFLEGEVKLVALQDYFLRDEDLKNEKITTYEIGYRGGFLNGRLKFGTDYFYNIMDDSINLISEEEAFRFANADKDTINRGFELSLRVRPINWLLGDVNYSYIDIYTRGEPKGPREYARNRANLSISLTPGKFLFTTFVRYVDAFSQEAVWAHFYMTEEEMMDLAMALGTGDPGELKVTNLLKMERDMVKIDSFISVDLKAGYRITDNIETGILAKNIGADDHLEAAGTIDENGLSREAEPIPTFFGAYIKSRF